MSEFSNWIKDNQKQIQIDLGAGTVSGIFNCLFGHPMDTLKVRMQMSKENFWRSIIKIIKNEGILAFYKGMTFPLLSVPFLNAIVFAVYEYSRRQFTGYNENGKSMSYFQTAICGGISGSCAAMLACSIDLTKCRLQMQLDNAQKLYKNPFDCLWKIGKQEGFRYIFRGMNATQQREILGYSAQFATYEFVKDQLMWLQDKGEPSSHDLLISGGLAGMACWIVGYPQDTIKTILQCEMGTKTRRFKPRFLDGGFFECLKYRIQNDGVPSLWRGFSACMLRAFYANAIGFYAYEISKNQIQKFYE
ncbi:unnamed protein product [Paramecium sonneborni]|uniref:Mitochondrial carrier protein n=1 Tax=Paramecium sonneborni TaxID=65129 RepID=A0A8S1LNW0_9CILI|nr:unnamed protein product [Paramecium sonneborni]